MAELDAKYYELKTQKSENESSQVKTNNELLDIDDKIERLETAYAILDDGKESIEKIKGRNQKLPDSYKKSWKGSNANTVFGACDGGDLQSNYESYINRIDGIEDAINNEICRLKNLRSEKYGILQGLIKAWNNISTQIKNYLN